MAKEQSYFEQLFSVDVSRYIEKKNGLSYLSWANAWAELKKRFPDAFYTIYETSEGRPYFTDGRTCWVKTGVTVNGIEHIEYLPIMDFRNQSIPLERVTSMDMNKAIQRSLTKACARHGIGLYVYAGEDLPEASDGSVANVVKPTKKVTTEKEDKKLQEAFETLKSEIDKAPSIQSLTDLYQKNPGLQTYQPFLDALSKRKKEVA